MGCRCNQRGAVIQRGIRSLANGQVGSAVRSGKVVASSMKTDAARLARIAAARVLQRPR